MMVEQVVNLRLEDIMPLVVAVEQELQELMQHQHNQDLEEQEQLTLLQVHL
tara:strand:- start:162 stop:314 length:153 start_codon:yes stop_codon:yes gene_type:complete